MSAPASDAGFGGNRVCALLDTRYPIVQAGMVWNSGWRLASAVANAGGLGLIGAGSMDAALLSEHITRVQDALAQAGGTVGVNVPLLYRHAPELLEVVVQRGVKIVFTSAGNPATWAPQLKAQGLTVVHVVAGARQALKAEAAGCDAVVAEGFEAGGHNGAAELTSMVLLPLVARAVQIPVIAAGGIATGAQMLAAMVLGAEGVQVGSRFAASVEGSGHAAFKQAIVGAGEDATRLMMKQVTPVRLLHNAFAAQVASAEQRGASAEELRELLGRGRARRGMFDGNLDEGELEIGQVAALIDDVPTAREILERMIAEYTSQREQVGIRGGKYGG